MNSTTRLVSAVRSDNPSAVRKELENGGNVNKCVPWDDFTSVPLLVIAAHERNDDVVAALLGGKPDVEAQGDYKRAPLSTAAKEGHTSIVTKLLDCEADIHKKDIRFGNTSVHWAAGRGVISVIEVLHKRGGRLEDVADDGKTPLHLAAKHGRMPMVEWLHHHEVNVAVVDKEGFTPADIAEKAEHMDISTFLRSPMALQQSLKDREKCAIFLYKRGINTAGISASLVTHWALRFSWPGGRNHCFEAFENNGILTPRNYEGEVDPKYNNWKKKKGKYTARDCSCREVIAYARQQGGNDYHNVTNNCQTFATDLAKQFKVNLPTSGSVIVNNLTSRSFQQQ